MQKKMFVPWQVFISVLLVLALTIGLAPEAFAAPVIPNSMTALGDSITVAYDSSGLGNQPANSWSTGTSTTVNSLYLRFLAQNPNISGQKTNLAVSGKKMVDLNGQASNVSATTEFITILMGANDVCTSSVSTMTSVTDFRTQFQTAMNTLAARAPNAKIYVLSIPDVYRLYDLFKSNASARSAWSLFKICQSMLANPTSTKKADVNRRAAVRQRNIDFNSQLAQVCATYTNCIFDNNAIFNTAFTTSDVSTIDYFHPSVAGQKKLANTAWTAAGFLP